MLFSIAALANVVVAVTVLGLTVALNSLSTLVHVSVFRGRLALDRILMRALARSLPLRRERGTRRVVIYDIAQFDEERARATRRMDDIDWSYIIYQ